MRLWSCIPVRARGFWGLKFCGENFVVRQKHFLPIFGNLPLVCRTSLKAHLVAHLWGCEDGLVRFSVLPCHRAQKYRNTLKQETRQSHERLNTSLCIVSEETDATTQSRSIAKTEKQKNITYRRNSNNYTNTQENNYTREQLHRRREQHLPKWRCKPSKNTSRF